MGKRKPSSVPRSWLYTQPRPNSQTFKLKAELLKNNPPVYVSCEKCNAQNKTLYQVRGQYYCKEHRPTES